VSRELVRCQVHTRSSLGHGPESKVDPERRKHIPQKNKKQKKIAEKKVAEKNCCRKKLRDCIQRETKRDKRSIINQLEKTDKNGNGCT